MDASGSQEENGVDLYLKDPVIGFSLCDPSLSRVREALRVLLVKSVLEETSDSRENQGWKVPEGPEAAQWVFFSTLCCSVVRNTVWRHVRVNREHRQSKNSAITFKSPTVCSEERGLHLIENHTARPSYKCLFGVVQDFLLRVTAS